MLHDLLKAFMEDNGTEGDEDLLFVLKVRCITRLVD